MIYILFFRFNLQTCVHLKSNLTDLIISIHFPLQKLLFRKKHFKKKILRK